MPRGEKSKYTARQKRMAGHIEEGYEKRGTPRKEAERRAWATVNKQTGGGQKKGGSGAKGESRASAGKSAKRKGRGTSTRSKGARTASRGKA